MVRRALRSVLAPLRVFITPSVLLLRWWGAIAGPSIATLVGGTIVFLGRARLLIAVFTLTCTVSNVEEQNASLPVLLGAYLAGNSNQLLSKATL